MARRDPFDRARPEERGVASEASAAYRDRARRLGLPFAADVDLGEGGIADVPGIREGTIAIASHGERLTFVAPSEVMMPAILAWLAAYPAVRPRLRVAPPWAIRAALVRSGGRSLAEDAIRRLAKRWPDLSAKRVITAGQGAAALAILAGLAAAAWFAPLATVVAANLIGAAFFFGVCILRLLAADHAKRREPPVEDMPAEAHEDDDALPVYTVLVPLHREAELVADLVAALDRLDWPRDKLDVKLLVEADDAATIAAARFAAARPPYEIIVVPPVGPRTKPKALAFALPLARGEFVTVYDAEDRPHPQQLREAYAVFRTSAPEVACLQSALVIDNGADGWLPLSFAVEYACLFDALLPTLAALDMPLPLGGTSNHFRRDALEEIGGWDPYNVTEDADLGIRFARFGYRVATLDLPTLEEAPTTFSAWFGQRTRWSKGWLQTWLVHTRHPLRLARDLGPRGLLGFALVSTGLIVSALIYPIYLAALVVGVSDPLRLWSEDDPIGSAIIGLSLFNLFAGYTAMALLSIRALKLRGRMHEAGAVALLPLFWLLVSLACYRALFQLVTRPHHWEKTPHRRRMPVPTRDVRRATPASRQSRPLAPL